MDTQLFEIMNVIVTPWKLVGIWACSCSPAAGSCR